MAWSFADEVDDYAEAVLDRLTNTRAVVPVLWPLEVANALLMGQAPETLDRGGIDQVDGHPLVFAHRDRRRNERRRLTGYDEPGRDNPSVRRRLSGVGDPTRRAASDNDEKLKLAAKAIGVALFQV